MTSIDLQNDLIEIESNLEQNQDTHGAHRGRLSAVLEQPIDLEFEEATPVRQPNLDQFGAMESELSFLTEIGCVS